MFLEDCKVLENKQVFGTYYLMKLKGEKSINVARAGQFYMLQCKGQGTILRRPISLHYIDKEKNIIEFYYEVKGLGTQEFSRLKEGDTLNLQGPLGNGFTTDVKDKTIVVVGGGMGIAPIKLLIERLKEKRNAQKILNKEKADFKKKLERLAKNRKRRKTSR